MEVGGKEVSKAAAKQNQTINNREYDNIVMVWGQCREKNASTTTRTERCYDSAISVDHLRGGVYSARFGFGKNVRF